MKETGERVCPHAPSKGKASLGSVKQFDGNKETMGQRRDRHFFMEVALK